MTRVILFLALAGGLMAVLYWLAYANTQMVATLLRRSGGVALLALAVYLALTGRWFIAVPVGWFGFSILRGGLPAGFGLSGNGRRTPGGQSGVRSRFLDMRLDLDSGDMDGAVLDGPFKGRMLGDMTQGELIALHAFVAGDEESTALLETYLDNRFPEWRDAAGAGQGGQRHTQDNIMSEADARRVLGVAPNATVAEIRSAHRSRMKRAHPDRGGSTYDAAKLNQARDVLLKTAGTRR